MTDRTTKTTRTKATHSTRAAAPDVSEDLTAGLATTAARDPDTAPPSGPGTARTGPPWTVWPALGGALVLWASAFVGIKATLHDFGPGPMALLRFLIASLAVLVVWVVTSRLRRTPLRLPARGDVPLLLLCSLLLIVIYNLGVNFGEQTVSSGTTSFLVGQVPVFSAVLAAAILRERVAVLGWVGIAVGVAGTVVMLYADQAGLQINAGALYVLGAALAESLYFVLSKPLLRKYGPTELNVFVTVPGTLMMLPFLGALTRDLTDASAGSVLVMVYLGVFPAAVAYLLWNHALSQLDVGTTTSALYVLPVVTVVISFLVLGELPGAFGLVGGLVALAGAVLVNTKRAR
ncbi:EamA family transporter [Streptomyces sp. NBC_00237]|uniref:DMT family transporter n=1 Tax=Streptomyces sp. NBC_00237 TaxID=2975687 RepID=UPI00225A1CBB|nr:EamA family transporter [Streptomyces sp. NBC_00237]MCX5205988.1 EamA family transporter [Streptomyces sp. NBC_00237]